MYLWINYTHCHGFRFITICCWYCFTYISIPLNTNCKFWCCEFAYINLCAMSPMQTPQSTNRHLHDNRKLTTIPKMPATWPNKSIYDKWSSNLISIDFQQCNQSLDKPFNTFKQHVNHQNDLTFQNFHKQKTAAYRIYNPFAKFPHLLMCFSYCIIEFKHKHFGVRIIICCSWFGLFSSNSEELSFRCPQLNSALLNDSALLNESFWYLLLLMINTFTESFTMVTY